jgi:threonine/homoserine/homoserine lactone efflux protein
MDLDVWLAFVGSASIVLAIPGPTVLLVVGYALSAGPATAWRTVPGVALGDALALTVTCLGLGAALATSASLFTAAKWLGAAYLVYLGARMWCSRPNGPVGAPRCRTGRSMTGHAFVVTALNPKAIAFYVAFLPQFVAPERPAGPQLLVLGVTFVLLAIVNASGYAVLAGRFHASFRRPHVLRTLNRIGGGVLVGAGIMTAALRRTA